VKQFIVLFVVLINFVGFSQDTKRCEGSEPSYLNRMPGFYISDCKNSDYNEKDFIYYEKGKANIIHKGGKYYEVWYWKNADETRQISSAQVRANYTNAILKASGKVLSSESSSEPVFTASINGKEVYISLAIGNSSDIKNYHIYVVEVEQMQQDIVINLEEAIDRDGKVALYGILFDTDKSTIKPESEKALQQIIDYLNGHPKVNIIVVGHTDMTGDFAHNMELSKDRAETVTDYLIKTGKIDPKRLASNGVGPLCPVSKNDSEDGKNLNRRVEVVKKLK
jgi:outer membrane protein OmpA-like peptidoglycan-associated protein